MSGRPETGCGRADGYVRAVSRSEPLTRALLDEFAERCEECGDRLRWRLAPPPSDGEVQTRLEELGVQVPPEVRTWWGWHNGIVPGESLLIAGSALRLASVDVAIQATLLQREIAESVEIDWPRSWLVLLPDLGGDLVVVETDHNASTRCSPIYFVMQEGPEPQLLTPQAPSIGTMVRWWIAAIDSGAYVFDHSKNRWVRHYERLDPARADTGLV